MLRLEEGEEEVGEVGESDSEDINAGFLDMDEESGSPSAANWELVPIDHGYSMPSRLKVSEWDWDWYNKPALKRPVNYRPKIYAKKSNISCVSSLSVVYKILTYLSTYPPTFLLSYLLIYLPHKVCKEIRDYVRTLDIEDIIKKTLEYSQLSEDTLHLLRCAHYFVVNGIEKGSTCLTSLTHSPTHSLVPTHSPA